MENITKVLDKKIGGQPVLLYVIIIGGGLGVYAFFKKKNAPQTVPELDVSPDTVNITRTTPGVIPQPIPIYQDTVQQPQGNGGSVEKNSETLSPLLPIAPAPITIPGAQKGNPQPQNPQPQPRPQPQPQPQKIVYPGFELEDPHPERGYMGLHGDYDTVYRHFKQNGMGDTFNTRNIMAAALQGTGSPWINRGDWADPAAINRRRVRYGLYPLTADEIQAAIKELEPYSAEGKLLSHSRDYFNRWNLPYQYSAANAVRRTR